MASKRIGLGRGLGALFPQSQISQMQPHDIVREILVSAIQPNRYQPRRDFDEEALNELAESIKSYGVLQPVIVRALDNNEYELIAGERRLRASKIVGLEKIPAIVREYNDAQMSEISIIENVQRENLNVIEEAHAYERLIKEFGHTQEIVAAKIGRSRSHISNIMRLLKLSPRVRELVSNGKLTLGQARPLLAIDNAVIQTQAAEMIIAEGLSVRKVEAFVNELKNSGLLASLMASPVNEESKTITASVTEVNPVENIDTIPVVEPMNTVDKVEIINDKKDFDIPVKKKTRSKIDTINKEKELYIHEAENKLTSILGAQVTITTSKRRNRIQIDFADEDELSRILESFEQSMFIMTNVHSTTPSTKAEKIAALRKFSTSQNFSI